MRKFLLTRYGWLAGVASVFAMVAAAAGPNERPNQRGDSAVVVEAGPALVQVGPAGVTVQAGPAQVEVAPEGVHVDAGPAKVQVDPGNVKVDAGPARVQVGPGRVRVLYGRGGEDIQVGRYWIGLECYPVEGALRAHLGLPEGQGLLVQRVMPDTPAAEVGIEKHDVLLTADGKPLGKIQDLIDAVDAAKDGKLSLEVLRGGKPVTLQLKPAKRPDPARPSPHPETPGELDERIQDYLDSFRNRGDKGRWGFRFWHPGTILPPDAPVYPPMPGNMAVTITKTGQGPAKIVVKQGDQTWESTEDNLDAFPPDIQPYVERMLGRIPSVQLHDKDEDALEDEDDVLDYDFDFVPNWRVPSWEDWDKARKKQMDDMNRRIDRLRESIEQMRQKRRPDTDQPQPEEEVDPDTETSEEKLEKV